MRSDEFEASAAVKDACAWEEEQKRSRDPHRPSFHVMPRLGWLNDPNGPIFHNGRYHLSQIQLLR